MGNGGSNIASITEVELLALCLHRELEADAGASSDFRAAAVRLSRKNLINQSIRKDRKTPLHLALDQAGAVEFLLNKCGANASFIDADGYTPLHYHLLKGPVPQTYSKKQKPPEIIVLEALARAKGLEVLTPDGQTAIHIAADNDDFVALSALLQGGANPDAQNSFFNSTALHIFMEKVNSAAVKSLVVNFANPNLRDQLNRTPLLIGAASGDFFAMDALLRSSKRAIPVKMNVKDVTGDPALVIALRHQHTEIVPLLVECKAQVNAPGARGESPLFVAAGFDLCDTVKFLIESEANLDMVGVANRTALCHALRCQTSTGTLKTLLTAKANLNICEGCNHSEGPGIAPWALWKEPRQCREYGDPPVVLAAKGGDPESLATLLDFGADPSDADELECTTLMAVAALGHAESLDILRPALPANEVKKRDWCGWTARMHAAARGSIETAEAFGDWWQEAPNAPELRRSTTGTKVDRRLSMRTQGSTQQQQQQRAVSPFGSMILTNSERVYPKSGTFAHTGSADESNEQAMVHPDEMA
eukprot:gnl/MRDRNA2_/MRDRNA2_113483_c0_seq1.p1 gnl/MRDRNA2_/MRDRNA2_113483_c0~~gnl/MRDRNA2_/MRDRNA2_113483_c0_seq1.p1  ORF type:complete len:534 (-),score=110.36 gnl/MRDRNA2_/MRDRNA2_113483_c0_seq1:103-1704(-)